MTKGSPSGNEEANSLRSVPVSNLIVIRSISTSDNHNAGTVVVSVRSSKASGIARIASLDVSNASRNRLWEVTIISQRWSPRAVRLKIILMLKMVIKGRTVRCPRLL